MGSVWSLLVTGIGYDFANTITDMRTILSGSFNWLVGAAICLSPIQGVTENAPGLCELEYDYGGLKEFVSENIGPNLSLYPEELDSCDGTQTSDPEFSEVNQLFYSQFKLCKTPMNGAQNFFNSWIGIDPRLYSLIQSHTVSEMFLYAHEMAHSLQVKYFKEVYSFSKNCDLEKVDISGNEVNEDIETLFLLESFVDAIAIVVLDLIGLEIRDAEDFYPMFDLIDVMIREVDKFDGPLGREQILEGMALRRRQMEVWVRRDQGEEACQISEETLFRIDNEVAIVCQDIRRLRDIRLSGQTSDNRLFFDAENGNDYIDWLHDRVRIIKFAPEIGLYSAAQAPNPDDPKVLLSSPTFDLPFVGLEVAESHWIKRLSYLIHEGRHLNKIGDVESAFGLGISHNSHCPKNDVDSYPIAERVCDDHLSGAYGFQVTFLKNIARFCVEGCTSEDRAVAESLAKELEKTRFLFSGN